MQVQFYFHATAFMSRTYYCLKVLFTCEQVAKEISDPLNAAHIVNKYASKITVAEDGFGYEADLPDAAVLALRYMVHSKKPVPLAELDEIVASGTTKLHELRRQLGVYEEDVRDAFFKNAVGKGLNLNFKSFPKLTLSCTAGSFMPVTFDSEGVCPEFLKCLLNEGPSSAEMAMLKGISLLKNPTKCMRLLSNGELVMDALARTLLRAANSAKDKDAWLPTVDWLKENGYGVEAGQVVAKKTLCK